MKNRNLTPDAVSIASHREVYLWDGVMTRIWRQNPRKWLEEHGRAELLGPFDSLVEEARALDAADGRAGYGIGHGKSSVKWSRFLKEAELNVSFEEWCLRFGHADLLAQWDEERNGSLKPSDVSRCDPARVWWRGECGHVYQMAVRDRVRAKPGYCPYCSGRKRPERPIRLDWPSAPRRGRNGGGGSAPPTYRCDFATNGLVSLA